jgi:hypothetical protein
MEIKPGYCINCGKQAMVRDFKGRCIGGLMGTKLVWLVLDYEDPEREDTKVGSLPVCAKCELDTLDPEKILQDLSNSPKMGFALNETERSLFKSLKIEFIKRFGD